MKKTNDSEDKFFEAWKKAFTLCYNLAISVSNTDLAERCRKLLDCPPDVPMDKEELLKTVRDCKQLFSNTNHAVNN